MHPNLPRILAHTLTVPWIFPRIFVVDAFSALCSLLSDPASDPAHSSLLQDPASDPALSSLLTDPASDPALSSLLSALTALCSQHSPLLLSALCSLLSALEDDGDVHDVEDVGGVGEWCMVHSGCCDRGDRSDGGCVVIMRSYM
jgi:hypothetical protein